MNGRHRVVVIGAGFGGLRVVRGLADADVDIVVVDAHNFHTFQPLLYQVATAGLDTDDIAYPIRGIFRRQRNAAVRVAAVTGIDLDRQTVTTTRGEPLEFDTLVVAAGTVSHDFGIDGVTDHTLPLKSVADAVAIRDHVLTTFEHATFDDQIGSELDVVVCGGGPTGVEMAGGLTELYDRVLRKDYPTLPVTKARITLVEAVDRVLGTFDESLSSRAEATLRERGVDVITGTPIASVDEGAVELDDGRRLEAGTIVWAAGVRAAPVAEMLGTELGRGGRIIVGDDLSVPEHPNVFAIGDIAVDPDRPLPQVAQPAIQGGKHVARQIERRLAGEQTETFDYTDKGSMATIGRNQAVAELPGGMKLSGPIGWLAWLALHLLYLIGFRNRLNVFVNWAWNYLTYDRASRLLAPSDD
ncbi:MAG: NAD(P)/FAD-dependent oxidoreductase [Ilumatobacter fluminis]|uniref:NAD(P)/FAD-dependent oxidoreductase n=1 Tax=Ilumatobacter fluminis TaxID=467091 RepID=UPI0032EE4073